MVLGCIHLLGFKHGKHPDLVPGIADYVASATESWESLSDVADLVESSARSRTDFLEECFSGVLDGVLVIYRTFESVELTGRFDEELVASLPISVKSICHNGKR
jgi:glyoxylate reductase